MPRDLGVPVNSDDVRQAANRLRGRIVDTPCALSHTLSDLIGAQIFVKFENLQFTGSFKERGALNKLDSLTPAQRKSGVIAMSAGNHAQGVAYNAQKLGIPATIVMPQFTPNVKVRHTRNLGATVILHGETLSDSGSQAQLLAQERELAFIHPYDDPLVVAGQGSVALEMLEQHPDLDVIVVPVGGGGLISGCAVIAKSINPHIEVIGVQTELYPSMAQVLRGEPVACGGQTIAEGIAVKRPGELTREIIARLACEIMTVPEDAIERAIVLYLEIEKTVVEGAGAAPLAALLHDKGRFRGHRVGLIVSGGNIDARLLASVIMRGMVRDGRIIRLRLGISDVPGQLAKISTLIARLEGNIIEVAHHRLLLGIPAKNAGLELLLETRDRQHGEQIIGALREAAFSVALESML